MLVTELCRCRAGDVQGKLCGDLVAFCFSYVSQFASTEHRVNTGRHASCQDHPQGVMVAISRSNIQIPHLINILTNIRSAPSSADTSSCPLACRTLEVLDG